MISLLFPLLLSVQDAAPADRTYLPGTWEPHTTSMSGCGEIQEGGGGKATLACGEGVGEIATYCRLTVGLPGGGSDVYEVGCEGAMSWVVGGITASGGLWVACAGTVDDIPVPPALQSIWHEEPTM